MNAVAIAVLLFSLTACSQHSQIDVKETGVLEGKVSIGPLHGGPARIDQTESDVPPELYASHKIVALNADQTIQAESAIDSKGSYRMELPAGTYWIDFKPRDIGFPGSNPPLEVTIKKGQTIQLDIDIDTGMR